MEKEYERIKALFKDVDEKQLQLVDGAIIEAARIRAELDRLHEIAKVTGLIKLDPNNPMRQKVLPVSKELPKLRASYTNIIFKLARILGAGIHEEDLVLDDYRAFDNGTKSFNIPVNVVQFIKSGGGTTANDTTFSFVNLEKLVDTYTPADKSIDIDGYTVAVKISTAAGNALKVKEDGLYVDALTNSTVVGADVVTKVACATEGNVVVLDENGKIKDSGLKVATLSEVEAYLDTIFA